MNFGFVSVTAKRTCSIIFITTCGTKLHIASPKRRHSYSKAREYPSNANILNDIQVITQDKVTLKAFEHRIERTPIQGCMPVLCITINKPCLNSDKNTFTLFTWTQACLSGQKWVKTGDSGSERVEIWDPGSEGVKWTLPTYFLPWGKKILLLLWVAGCPLFMYRMQTMDLWNIHEL